MTKENPTPTKRPTKRKAKPRAKTICLTQRIYLAREMRRQKAIKEFHHFLNYASEAEKSVVRHLKPLTFEPEDLMKEIRRLLDESKAKCAVIPSRQNVCRKTIYLTSKMRHEKAVDEFCDFYTNASESDRKVIMHLKDVIGIGNVMHEVRKLLGEHIEKCKVITLPVKNER